MDWKKELKETNWAMVLVTVGIFVMVVQVVIDQATLKPLPIHIQYLTTLMMMYLLARIVLRKNGE